MLSRLLRAMFISQILTGALLGWLIARQTGSTLWFMVPVTLLLQPVISFVVILTTAVKSYTSGANGLWLRSVFFEYGACLRIYMLQLPWAFSPPKVQLPPVSPSPSRSPIPVVLVHGYICNHRVWDAMAQRLLSAGHPVVCVDLEPLFASIDDYAPLIEKAVQDIGEQTSVKQVVLIGHSMGGLAIRAWMRVQGTSKVARVVTLGTPHVGTQIAHIVSTTNGKQMLWHSDWLQELGRSESESARSLMRIALTPQDNIVFPQREQVIKGVPVTVFNGLGHLELCRHGQVIDWVLQQLSQTQRPTTHCKHAS